MSGFGTQQRRNERGAASRWAVAGVGVVALLGVIGVTAVAQGGSEGSEVVTRAEAALERADISGAEVEERDGVVTVSGVDADQTARIPDVLAGVEGVEDIKIDASGAATGPVESATGDGASEDEPTTTTTEDAEPDETDQPDETAEADLPTDEFLTTPEPPGAVPDVPLPEGAERMGVYQGGKLYLIGDVPSYEEGNRRITATREILGEDGVINLYEVDADTSTNDDGLIIVAEPFVFPPNSAVLPEEFFGLAEIGVAIMKRFPNAEMKITGHTDTSGSAELNTKLSQDRADSLKTYMVDREIEPDRISAEGKGSSEPAFPNDTAANRAKNRRIEVSLEGILKGE